MKQYTVGFVVTEDFGEVLLMTKNRPAWQVGQLNGIGGRFEDGEESTACMAREAKEEVGLESQPSDWVYIGVLERLELTVDFYYMLYLGEKEKLFAQTDEQVAWYPMHALPPEVIPSSKQFLEAGQERWKENQKN